MTETTPMDGFFKDASTGEPVLVTVDKDGKCLLADSEGNLLKPFQGFEPSIVDQNGNSILVHSDKDGVHYDVDRESGEIVLKPDPRSTPDYARTEQEHRARQAAREAKEGHGSSITSDLLDRGSKHSVEVDGYLRSGNLIRAIDNGHAVATFLDYGNGTIVSADGQHLSGQLYGNTEGPWIAASSIKLSGKIAGGEHVGHENLSHLRAGTGSNGQTRERSERDGPA